ncbi:MAG TPA: zinc metallopeptidase [Anaerolineales bacterium]|nr:zinc metallopeptidase [Anaerolineales bacterium]
MFFDSRYLMYMLPAFLLMMLAQAYVSMAYRRWSQVPARSRLTGAQAAQRLMMAAGLYHIRIEGIRGNLTDHYDPSTKVLRLSEGVYNSPSVAALAIAAHELGHAMQDQEGYFLLRLRAALVPAVNIGSYLGWILIVLGLMLQMANLAWLGVLVFSGGALFALATLPVELDASARARRLLADTGIVAGEDEARGVNSVLTAAALTYVASLFSAVMQLLYFTGLAGGIGRRED